MLTIRRLAIILALPLGAVAFSPAVRAASHAMTVTEACSVLGVDPDTVSATSPALAPIPGQPAVATVTASETPQEAGPNAPTVRLFVYIHNDLAPADLLAESTGAFSKGPITLSGPATGKFKTTESIRFTAAGTYMFDFLALFDNGIHPCTSLAGLHPSLTITVP